MKCLGCDSDFDLAAWLDKARGAILPRKWVACDCPSCAQVHHLQLNDGGRIVFGQIDGVPGPCLIPSEFLTLKDLSASWDDTGVTVGFGERSWQIDRR